MKATKKISNYFIFCVVGLKLLCVGSVYATESTISSYEIIQNSVKTQSNNWDEGEFVPFAPNSFDLISENDKNKPELFAPPPGYEGNPIGVPVNEPAFLFIILIAFIYCVFNNKNKKCSGMYLIKK